MLMFKSSVLILSYTYKHTNGTKEKLPATRLSMHLTPTRSLVELKLSVVLLDVCLVSLLKVLG